MIRTQKYLFGWSVGFHARQLSNRHGFFCRFWGKVHKSEGGFEQKSKQFWEPFAWENGEPFKEGLRKLEVSDL